MPNPTTAWSLSQQQRSRGVLTSERISPQPSRGHSPNLRSSKLPGQPQASSTSSSPEVLQLQKIITQLQQSASPKPGANVNIGGVKDRVEQGCFCLAQTHKLSPYTPLCVSCGLILYELHPPYRNCPFTPCGQPLLTPQARTVLIQTLNDKIVAMIEAEEIKRRREEEERRQAAGAFPMLAPSSSLHVPGTSGKPRTPPPPSSNTPHKVLSLTQKGAVLTTTVRKTTPTPSAQGTKGDPKPVVQRVPMPPEEPVSFKPKENMAPWESLRFPRIIYEPPPPPANPRQPTKRQKKGQKKDNIEASDP